MATPNAPAPLPCHLFFNALLQIIAQIKEQVLPDEDMCYWWAPWVLLLEVQVRCRRLCMGASDCLPVRCRCRRQQGCPLLPRNLGCVLARSYACSHSPSSPRLIQLIAWLPLTLPPQVLADAAAAGHVCHGPRSVQLRTHPQGRAGCVGDGLCSVRAHEQGGGWGGGEGMMTSMLSVGCRVLLLTCVFRVR